MQKFSDLQHRGWSQLSFCSKFICINKAEGDIKQKALKACRKPQDTVTVFSNEVTKILFRKVFFILSLLKFQFYLLLFPFFIFHFTEVMFNINNAIPSLLDHQSVHLVSAKLTTNPLFRGLYGGFIKEGKKPCAEGWRPSSEQATGL